MGFGSREESKSSIFKTNFSTLQGEIITLQPFISANPSIFTVPFWHGFYYQETKKTKKKKKKILKDKRKNRPGACPFVSHLLSLCFILIDFLVSNFFFLGKFSNSSSSS